MPVKWKIFSAANILVILVMLLILVFAIVGIQNTPGDEDIYNWAFFVFLFIVLILVVHCINNLVLVVKFYPEKKPGKTFSVFSTVILVLSILFFIFLAIVGVYNINEEYNAEPGEQEDIGKTMSVFLLLTALIGLYTCFYQVVLRKIIRRNFDSEINRFLVDTNP